MCTTTRCTSVLVLALMLLLLPTLAAANKDVARNPNFVAKASEPMEFPRTDFLTEGFEYDWPPVGWAVLDLGTVDPGSYPWAQTDSRAHTGQYSAWVQYGPLGIVQDEWLVTYAVDLSAATMPLLEFWESESYWANYGLRHYIAVSTTDQTDPAAFTVIADWNPGNHTIPSDFTGPPVTVDLSAYAGEPVVYVAFVYEGIWADDWYIDDVRIYEPNDHDVACMSVAPAGDFYPGDTILPQATVKNVGLNPESFAVQMEVSESGTVISTETFYVANLAAGAETTVDFASLTLAGGNYYNLIGTTMLAGDEDPSNDTAMSTCTAYTEQRVPFGFLFTNAGCGPCVNVNQALDAYMPTQDNEVALARIHTWWPNPNDIMYTYNPVQIDPLVDAYGIWGVPWMWIDGIDHFSTSASQVPLELDARKLVPSPLTLEMEWAPADELLIVQVNVVNNIPEGDYRLKIDVTENDIHFSGGNGEPIHNQAFRYRAPDLDGLAISTVPGMHQYVVSLPIDPIFMYDELKAIVFVQEGFRGLVLNSATAFLHTNPVAMYLNDFAVVPTANMVNISWSVRGEPGVFELEANSGHVDWSVPYTWEGTNFTASDNSPNLASGGTVTYSLYHRTGSNSRELLRSETVELPNTPAVTRFMGANPNPFNPQTNVKFSVGSSQRVLVAVYDMSGRRVAVLADEVFGQGIHTLLWDGRDAFGHAVSSGTYFARMEADNFLSTMKLMLVR